MTDQEATLDAHDDPTMVDAGEDPAAVDAGGKGKRARGRKRRKGEPEQAAEHTMAVDDHQADEESHQRAPRAKKKGLLEGLFGADAAPSTDAERQQEAAEELAASMHTAMEKLVEAVPGARSPEEALAVLEEWRSSDPVDASEQGTAAHVPHESVETEVIYRVRGRLRRRPAMTPHQRDWSGVTANRPEPTVLSPAQMRNGEG